MKQAKRRIERRRMQVLMEALDGRVLLTGTPPTAALILGSQPQTGAAYVFLLVIYSDETGVNASTVARQLTVTGPGNFQETATLVSAPSVNAPVIEAIYRMLAPNGAWGFNTTGTYPIALVAGTVADIDGNFANGGVIGTVSYNYVGSTDPNFGYAGREQFETAGFDQINDVLAQPDGKIIAVGSEHAQGSPDMLLVERFNLDGTLDPSFGSGGSLAIASANGASISASGIVRAVDGSFIVGGTNGDDFAVYRITPDGAEDFSFAAGGAAAIDVNGGSIDAAHAITLDANGNILIVGESFLGGTTDAAVVRLTPGGLLDSSFGSGGKQIFNYGSYAPARAVRVLNNGAVVIGGEFGVSELTLSGAQIWNNATAPVQTLLVQNSGEIVYGGFGGTLGRLNADGSADGTFVNSMAGVDVNDLLDLGDGTLIVSGLQSTAIVAAKITTDGSLVSTFGQGGIATALFNGAPQVAALAVQSDGSIFVGGTIQAELGDSQALVRFDTNGVLDAAFAIAGRSRISPGGSFDPGTVITRAPDGGILVGGNSGLDHDAAIYRFGADGLLDQTFGSFGAVVSEFLTSTVTGITTLADGSILAAITVNNSQSVVVIKTDKTGNYDNSFGTNGILTVDLGSAVMAQDGSVLVLPDGRIVVGATAQVATGASIKLMAFDAQGNLDPSFGSGGIVTPDFSSTNTRLVGMQLSADANNIVVFANLPGIATGQNQIGLDSFNLNGVANPTFGSGGRTIVQWPDFGKISVAVQADGSYLVAEGSTLARFNQSGVLETTAFSGAGFLPTNFTITGLVTDDRSLIYLLGPNTEILRLLADGTVDMSFGQFGTTIPIQSPGAPGQPTTGGMIGFSDDRVIVATNVTNSSGFGDIVLEQLIPHTSAPDLSVQDITYPASVTAKIPFTVDGHVINSGDVAAGPFDIQYYFVNDQDFTTGILATQSVAGLAAGAVLPYQQDLVIDQPPGNYHINVWVDSGNSVVESNEGNNITSTGTSIAVGPSPAELSVDSVVPLASSIVAGGTLSVQVDTGNTGGQDTGPFGVNFYLSTDAVLSANDLLVSTLSMASMPPNVVNRIIQDINIPANLAGGQYYVIAKAGPVTEIDTTNNVLSSASPVQVNGAPNLKFNTATVDSSVQAGSSFNFSATVGNIGQSMAVGTSLRMVLSTDAIFGNGDDVLLGNFPVPTLVAGGQSTVSGSLGIPPATGAGAYNVLMVVDPTNAIAESIETDNFAQSALAVSAAPADLSVPVLSYGTSATAGGSVPITLRIQNNGFTRASSPQVRYFLSTDATLGVNDLSLGTFSYSDVAAQSVSGTIPQNLNIPQNTAGGNYFIIAQVNPNGTVAESDTSNNVAVGTQLSIAPAPAPDVSIQNISYALNNQAGFPIDVNVDLKNIGNANSSSSTLNLYLAASAFGPRKLLGTFAVGSLASQQTLPLVESVTLPANLIGGTYAIMAEVITSGDANSANDLANGADMNVTATANLTSGPVTIPTSATAGDSIPISFSFTNNGVADSGIFHYTINLVNVVNSIVLNAGTAAINASGTQVIALPAVTIPINVPAGTYRVKMLADSDNEVIETDETDNSSVSSDIVIAAGRADLDFPVPDSYVSTATAGDSLSVTVQLENSGFSAAVQPQVAYFLSTDTTLDALDIPLGTFTYPDIGAQTTGSAFNQSLTSPVTTTGGTYFIIAQLNPNNTIDESDTKNNINVGNALTIAPAQPNLLVSQLSYGVSAEVGSSLGFGIAINNAGIAPAADSMANVYLSADSLFGNADDVLIASVNAGAVGADQTVTLPISANIPSGIAPGNYFVFAVADGGDQVSESDETDNVTKGSVQIAVTAPPAQISLVNLTYGSTFHPGESISITPTVQSGTTFLAVGFTASFYVSTDATFSADDVLLTTQTYAWPNSSNAVDVDPASVRLPQNLTPGSYFIIGVAQPNSVPQSDQPTSILAGSAIDVQPLTPADLSISSLSFTSGSYFPASTFTFLPVIANTGQLAATAFKLELHLSTDAIFGNADDTTISTLNFAGLNGGSNLNVGATTVTLSGPIVPGNYYLLANVDSANQVPESVETNNNSSSDGPLVTIAARPVPVDVTVGGLNDSYGTAGVASNTFVNLLFTTVDAKATSTGQFIAAGYTTNTGDWFLTRFNTDGSLDTTFGDGGITLLDLRGTFDTAAALALGSDGSIYLAGDSTSLDGTNQDFAVAHFTSDGQLDTAFGGGGFAIVDLGTLLGAAASDDFAKAIKLSSDGKIYIAGLSAGVSDSDFAVIRLNSTGSIDPTFNATGAQTVDFFGKSDTANALVVQSDGRVVLAGSAETSAGSTLMAAARLNTDGSLDTTFGGDGRATINIGGIDDEAFAADIQSDGKIVLGGYSASGSLDVGTTTTAFAIARLKSNGKLDTSFGHKGSMVTSIPGNPLSGITRLKIQDNGKIITAGKTAHSLNDALSGNLGVALTRYDSAGNLDPTFSDDGILLLFQPVDPANPAAPGDGLVDQFESFVAAQTGLVDIDSGGGILAMISSQQPDDNSTTISIASVVADGVDLTAQLKTTGVKASIIGGANGSATVTIRNTGSLPVSGNTLVNFYLSTDKTHAADGAFFHTTLMVKLKPNTAKTFKVKFVFPSDLEDGNYFLIADVNSDSAVNELTAANNDAPTTTATQIIKPVVDLVATFTGTLPDALVGGTTSPINLTITNNGTVPAKGGATIRLLASGDQVLGDDDIQLLSLPKNLNIKPHKSLALKLKLMLAASAVPTGGEFLVGVVDFTSGTEQINPDDKIVFSDAMIAFS